jgi:hypothetical protein
MLKGRSRADGEERRIRWCADMWQPGRHGMQPRSVRPGKRHARDEVHCIRYMVVGLQAAYSIWGPKVRACRLPGGGASLVSKTGGPRVKLTMWNSTKRAA